jgi:hypothetical protein
LKENDYGINLSSQILNLFETNLANFKALNKKFKSENKSSHFQEKNCLKRLLKLKITYNSIIDEEELFSNCFMQKLDLIVHLAEANIGGHADLSFTWIDSQLRTYLTKLICNTHSIENIYKRETKLIYQNDEKAQEKKKEEFHEARKVQEFFQSISTLEHELKSVLLNIHLIRPKIKIIKDSLETNKIDSNSENKSAQLRELLKEKFKEIHQIYNSLGDSIQYLTYVYNQNQNITDLENFLHYTGIKEAKLINYSFLLEN